MVSTWNTAQSGQWNVAANWTGGIPNATDATANFTTLGTTASPWSIDLGGTTETVGTLNVSASIFEHYDFDNGTLAMKISSTARGASAYINVSSVTNSAFNALDSSLTLSLLSATTIDNLTAGVFDVAAKITGSGALLATGLGTVQIDNSANNWTGGLFIEGGTVQTLGTNVLAGGTLDVDTAGAILDLNGHSQSVANLTGSGIIETFTGNATLTVNETVNTTFSGTFEDGVYGYVSGATLGLTKTGAATLTLAGDNITQGVVTINQGAIALGSTDALSFTSGVSIASGASLDLAGFNTQLLYVSGAGSIVNSGSGAHFLQLTGSSNFAGSISGAINIQLDASYTSLALSGTNAYTGTTVILGGSTLKAGASGAFSVASAYYIDAASSIDLNGFNETIALLSGSGKITNNTSGASSSTLTFQNSGVTIYTGKIVDGSGGGKVGLDVAGAGQLVLAGANAYSGSSAIEAGATLVAGADNALSASSVIDIKTGGALDLAGYNEMVGGLTDTGAVTSSLTGDVTLTVGSSSFAGAITDGAAVVGVSIAANAAFHLSGYANTYSGATEIGANAKLYADNYGALSAASTVDISATGQLVLGSEGQTIGGLTGSGTVALASVDYVTLTVDESAATTFSGQFSAGPSGSGVNLTKTGAATLTLTGNNSQAGDMSVEAGTLAAGAANAFTAMGSLVIYGGATLDLGGFNQTIGNLASSFGAGGTVTNSGAAAATLTVLDTQGYFTGAIQNGAGIVNLNLAALSVLGLSGVNTYTGTTKVGAGAKLYAGATNAFSATSALSIGITGVVDLKGYNQAVGALSGTGSVTNSGGTAATLTETNAAASSFTGTLSDGSSPLAFVKVGAGQLKLTGTNTYSGGTTIQGGDLEFASTASAGSGAVTFAAAAGATLQLDGAMALTNTIEGFAVGDTIDLAGVAFAAGDHFVWASTVGGVQTWLLENAVGGTMTTLKLAGHYGAGEFTIAAQQSGTVIGLAHNPQPLTEDFDDNNDSDILFQNTSTGQASIWLMDGTTKLASSGPVSTSPGISWREVGSGDFNGDGKADILFQNTSTGQASIWFMDGTTKLAGSGPVGTSPGTSWRVIGSGDFNGDGKSDILFQNTSTGQANIWLMDGATELAGSGPVSTSPGASWRVVGSGDFNDDGKSDILWQNSDGQAGIWFMNGTTKLAGSGVISTSPGSSWKVIGSGDFNGDGESDILWQNSDGELDIWTMNGATVVSKTLLSSNPGSAWHAISTGDFNSDGNADILFQNTNGQAAIWLMSGTTKLAGSGPLSSNPGTAWHIVS